MVKFVFICLSLLLVSKEALCVHLIDNSDFKFEGVGWHRQSLNGLFFPLSYKEYNGKVHKKDNFIIVVKNILAFSSGGSGNWDFIQSTPVETDGEGAPLWAAATFRFASSGSTKVKMEIIEYIHIPEQYETVERQIMKRQNNGRKTIIDNRSHFVKIKVADARVEEKLLYQKNIELTHPKWVHLKSDYPVYTSSSNSKVSLKISFNSHCPGDLCVSSGQLATEEGDLYFTDLTN